MSKEILLVVEAVSNEKSVPEDLIFSALEQALVVVTKKRFAEDVNIKVKIDRTTGKHITFREWQVVDAIDLENPASQLSLEQAKEKTGEIKQVGDVLDEVIPSVEFGRIAAQIAKQVIVQKIREAERMQLAESFQSKVGTIIFGTVKKITRDNIIVDLGNNVDALLSRSEVIPRELFRVGSRIRALLREIRSDQRGIYFLLSRTDSQMLVELFKLEVPEIVEGLIEIMAVAREPGSRAKIAVRAKDKRIDAQGACIGMRSARVHSISNELNGERVDVVLWDENPAQFVINSMSPAEVEAIIVDEDSHSMDIAVAASNLNKAIGRGGQNVRLASDLTGWILNVMTQDQINAKQQAEISEVISLFMQDLEVEEDIAQALANEGFATLEEVAYVPLNEMLSIEGFDEEIANELRIRAKNQLLARALSDDQNAPDPDLLSLEGMDTDLANVLAKNGIISREDLAEQAVDELVGITKLDDVTAGKLIMTARAHWFE